jgi:peptidoglycan/xylan/chitin deacetylase (PgdA/CDA1 family)
LALHHGNLPPGSTVLGVPSGHDAQTPRRAARHRRGPQWSRFAIAVAITTALVVLFGAGPLELSGNGAEPNVAASIHAVVTDLNDAAPAPSTSSAPVSTAGVPTTTAPPTTTLAPTTTTTTPPLRVPGLGLLPQPTPTPVPLPPTGSAPVFSRIPTTNKVIFLGIDDGIVRDPAVADLLKQANIPFMMFLVQGEADAGVDYFRQLQQYGGVVEAHTINHPDLTKVSASQLQTEVCGTLDDFQTQFGRRPTLFRPPYGNTNANVQAVAASCGFKAVVLWKGSTNDGRFDLQEGTQLTPGDIVLMHFRTDLLANLQRVFAVCKQQGFAIASLEDYLR